MSVLYIIGNGFDLEHGLPTSYLAFRNYAGESLTILEEYFSFDLGDDRQWRDFENKLGYFDDGVFYDNHCLNDDAESFGEAAGVADDIEQQAENMVAQLRNDFENWIGSIDLTSTVPRLTLCPNARFLSFNYTAVLQMVYGIFEANVLHIHGSAANSDRLIFGHGDEITEVPELDENGDSNRHRYSDAESTAKAPLYAFKKQTSSIIKENADWFLRLTGVRTVVVLGLSLNDIDIPYIRQVHASAHDARWIVSCYQPTEDEHHRSQLTKIGIKASRITCCPIGDCVGHI